VHYCARFLGGAGAPFKCECPHDDSGLKLPAGFCATVFADGIGHARRMVAAPNGVIYVNTWSGEYYDNAPPHAGGFLVALQDTKGAGKADVVERFGESVQTGASGNCEVFADGFAGVPAKLPSLHNHFLPVKAGPRGEPAACMPSGSGAIFC
jgi:hypothetical protein